MTSHDNAYAAFMLDYAVGVLSPAERLAADLHRALSPEGGRIATVLDAIGGALLERAPLAPAGFPDAARFDAQETISRPTSSLDRYINSDLLALKWRKNIIGLKMMPTDTPMASLLRLDPGERTPPHHHGRRDVTVVLTGTYGDEFGVYERGDIAIAEPGLKHQPRAVGDKPCVCLIATESGKFVSGFLGLFGWGAARSHSS
jgi:putative transcriptional regulator